MYLATIQAAHVKVAPIPGLWVRPGVAFSQVLVKVDALSLSSAVRMLLQDSTLTEQISARTCNPTTASSP